VTDTDIRAALAQATGALRPPPDLLDRVRAGGRRRVVRRRSLLAAGLATVAGGSTAGVLLAGRGGGGTEVASPLLDRPTRGDLRGDRAFRDQLRAAWRKKVGNIPVRGEPHVVWAGVTPAGRAGVVAQRVPQEVVSSVGQIRYGMLGFAEETAGGLRMISLEEMLTQATNATAALLGRERSVLLVLDDGRRVRWSPEPSYTPAGEVDRAFTPLDFRAHDGAALVATEASRTMVRVGLRADVPDEQGDRSVGLANLSQLIGEAGLGSPWDGAQRLTRSLTGSDSTLSGGGPWDLATRDGFDDRWGYRVAPPPDTWLIRGTTADRREFAVQTLAGTDDRIRLFLSLGTPDPVLRGFPDPATPLPVQVRLPDGQGVVVAARGRLRYRVRRGSWLPVAGDAALVPAAADEVEVTPFGGRAIQVALA
jgi:hypothetical protein